MCTDYLARRSEDVSGHELSYREDDKRRLNERLIIPLIPSIHSDSNKSRDGHVEYDLKYFEDVAAEEMKSGKSDMTMRRITVEDTNDLNSGAFHDKQVCKKNAVPLLLSAQHPGLNEIVDESDRLKADLELRANDVDFNSSIYKNVPIEKFGEAMLRGMGWTGEEMGGYKDGIVESTPRVFRLGLGALPKPSESSKKRSKHEVESNEEWDTKAHKKKIMQQICDGDIVVLLDELHAGRRACVIKCLGIPGLDKIQVALETSGEIAEISKMDVTLVSKKELLMKPFSYTAASFCPQQSLVGGLLATQLSNRSGYNDVDEYSCKKKRKHNESKLSITTNKTSDSRREKFSWLRDGIRVKLISTKLGGDKYLKKGTVIDTYGKGVASIRLDTGELVENVKEKFLETILPQLGGKCLILIGEYAGQYATLLERKKGDSNVTVQIEDDKNIVVVDVDDVAAVGADVL